MIKELEVMNEFTLNNYINDIKAKGFIIGSVTANGFSFSTTPRVHTTAQLARAEAKRLSTAQPGKLFVIVQFYGAELMPTQSAFSI